MVKKSDCAFTSGGAIYHMMVKAAADRLAKNWYGPNVAPRQLLADLDWLLVGFRDLQKENAALKEALRQVRRKP